MLSSFRLYYIQFKEVKTLSRSGGECEGLGPDNPNTLFYELFSVNLIDV